MQLRSNAKLEIIHDAVFTGAPSQSLQRLVVHDCPKFAALPDSVGGCSALESVCVSQCGLTALPEAVTCLGRLHTLRAFGNVISRLPSYWSLVYLEELDLGNNDLTELPEGLCSCRHLRVLKVQRNNIAALPEAVGRLLALEDVDFSRNVLFELPAAAGEWRALVRASFSHNKLKALPESVAQWTHLQELDLERNRWGRVWAPLSALAPDSCAFVCLLSWLCSVAAFAPQLRFPLCEGAELNMRPLLHFASIAPPRSAPRFTAWSLYLPPRARCST